MLLYYLFIIDICTSARAPNFTNTRLRLGSPATSKIKINIFSRKNVKGTKEEADRTLIS